MVGPRPNCLERLGRAVETIHWLKRVAVVWFVRTCWLPCLCWGLYDVWVLSTRGLIGKAYEEKEADAAIRTTTGIVLGLIWLFLVRRSGPWTYNRGGRLEVPPWRGAP